MAKPAKNVEMKPFLFERSFDAFGSDRQAAAKAAEEEKAAAAAAEEAANAPPEPEDPAEPELEVVHTEEEMAEAKQEAYMNGHADGFREGYADAMDTLESRLNELLEKLAPLVSDLGKEQALANERAQANMARIVQALMGRLMPVYMKKHGADEALAVVSDCLAELQDPGRLTVRLSEETADLLGDRLSKAADRAGFEGQIRLLTDETLGPSDVRVDWGAGGAERHYDSIREEIDAAIDRAVARAEDQLAEREEERVEEQAAEPESPAPSPHPEETTGAMAEGNETMMGIPETSEDSDPADGPTKEG